MPAGAAVFSADGSTVARPAELVNARNPIAALSTPLVLGKSASGAAVQFGVAKIGEWVALGAAAVGDTDPAAQLPANGAPVMGSAKGKVNSALYATKRARGHLLLSGDTPPATGRKGTWRQPASDAFRQGDDVVCAFQPPNTLAYFVYRGGALHGTHTIPLRDVAKEDSDPSSPVTFAAALGPGASITVCDPTYQPDVSSSSSSSSSEDVSTSAVSSDSGQFAED